MGGRHKGVGLYIIIGVVKNVRTKIHKQGKDDDEEYSREKVFDIEVGVEWNLVNITIYSEGVIGAVLVHIGKVYQRCPRNHKR
jgi:hypothetical protein